MEDERQQEREVRAARNQALFRAVNENLRNLNEAFADMTNTFAIACECANTNCVDIIEIDPTEYLAVRAQPRHFAVRPGHVYADVEFVVRESPQYVVVEKNETAGEVVEDLARELDPEGR